MPNLLKAVYYIKFPETISAYLHAVQYLNLFNHVFKQNSWCQITS